MKKYFELFITFFKIGLFTFGGGYAMISIIENECVNKHKWISEKQMQEIIVMSESTPGPIAINASTFIGYLTGKVLGSILATLATALPSLIIITLISIFLEAFNESVFISFIFQAIRASVIILMCSAFLNLSKKVRKNYLFYILLVSSLILNLIFNVKSIYIILFALLYTCVYLIATRNKKEEKENA